MFLGSSSSSSSSSSSCVGRLGAYRVFLESSYLSSVYSRGRTSPSLAHAARTLIALMPRLFVCLGLLCGCGCG